MDRKRILELLEKIKVGLTQEVEVKTINIFDFFELVEHIAKDVLGDITPVYNCSPECVMARKAKDYLAKKETKKPKPKGKNGGRKAITNC